MKCSGYWDWFHGTEDLMRIEYYCQSSDYCDYNCPYEDECWWSYESCRYLHATDWMEHYFTMIYSEGEEV